MSEPQPLRESDEDSTIRLRDCVRLEREFVSVEPRLERIEDSRISRFLSYIGRVGETQWRKAGQILLHSPFHPLYLRLWGWRRAKSAGSDYARWLAQEEARWPSRQEHQDEAALWPFQPTISILLPTFRPRSEWLARAIESVKAQSYEKWQLCVCDDGSDDSWVREYLQSEAVRDPRIRTTFLDSNSGISAALNAAAELAIGEYVTFLDHDDELHPYVLHYVASALQEDAVDVLYTDEDHLDSTGARSHPFFKPDWSPELLTACMYFGHLMVVTRSLLEEIGWFRTAYDGAQDFDLALRLVERARKIRHVRRVLYHWRQHPQSTTMNLETKPYAQESGRRALSDALMRRHEQGFVESGPLPYTYFIRRPLVQERVSVIVCSRDRKRLAAFIKGQQRTRYRSVELVVVDHIGSEGSTLERLLERTACVRVPFEGTLNFSLMNNLGAEAAGSEFLVFLDDGVTPIDPEWLDVMVAHLSRREIGVVGGQLLYPSGAIQHAGVAVGLHGGAGHPGRGAFRVELMNYVQLPRDVSAVTGACLGIRRSVFKSLGGFNPSFPVNYYDVDFCLRVRESGYRVLVDPRVKLTHVECAARRGSATFAERQLFRERWRHVLESGDPYYPDAFDHAEEVRLAVR
jgi:O-antigen biosynthesis protein